MTGLSVNELEGPRDTATRAHVVGRSLAFAAGWTPCIGPFLAGLLALASQEQTVGQGMLLLFVYGLGLGVPFVLKGLALGMSLRQLTSVFGYGLAA